MRTQAPRQRWRERRWRTRVDGELRLGLGGGVRRGRLTTATLNAPSRVRVAGAARGALQCSSWASLEHVTLHRTADACYFYGVCAAVLLSVTAPPRAATSRARAGRLLRGEGPQTR